MGIRAVQAGALTAEIDRPLAARSCRGPRLRPRRSVPRDLRRTGANPAVIAHRYALGLDIDTLVLGVKNRQELRECVEAAEAGPLPPDLMKRIDDILQGARNAA